MWVICDNQSGFSDRELHPSCVFTSCSLGLLLERKTKQSFSLRKENGQKKCWSCINSTVWLLSLALQWFFFSLWVSGFHFILPNTSWIPGVLFLLHLLTFHFCPFFFPFCCPYPSVSCSRKCVEVEFTLKKSQQEYQVAASLSSHCSFNRQPQLCFANFDRESVSNRIAERHLVSFRSVPSWMIPWEDTVFVL